MINLGGSVRTRYNGIVKPIRLWLIGLTPNTLRNQTAPFFTALVLKQMNIRINDQNRFTNGLSTPYDLWTQLKDQMQELATSPDKGSLVTFTDFYPVNVNQFLTTSGTSLSPFNDYPSGLLGLYCIDLAHTQGRVDDASVDLIIDSIKASGIAATLDYYILVERESTAILEFNRNSVSIQVGSF